MRSDNNNFNKSSLPSIVTNRSPFYPYSGEELETPQPLSTLSTASTKVSPSKTPNSSTSSAESKENGAVDSPALSDSSSYSTPKSGDTDSSALPGRTVSLAPLSLDTGSIAQMEHLTLSTLNEFKFETDFSADLTRIKNAADMHRRQVLETIMKEQKLNFRAGENPENIIMSYITHIWDENIEVLSFAIKKHSFGIYYTNEFTQLVKRTGSAVNNILYPHLVAHLKEFGDNVSFNVRHYDDLQSTGLKSEFNFKDATIFVPICYTTTHALEREGLIKVMEFFYMKKNCNVIIYLGTDDGLESNVKLRDLWLAKNENYITALMNKNPLCTLKISKRADLIEQPEYRNAERYFVDEVFEKKNLSRVLVDDVVARLAKKNQILVTKSKSKISRSLFHDNNETKETKENKPSDKPQANNQELISAIRSLSNDSVDVVKAFLYVVGKSDQSHLLALNTSPELSGLAANPSSSLPYAEPLPESSHSTANTSFPTQATVPSNGSVERNRITSSKSAEPILTSQRVKKRNHSAGGGVPSIFSKSLPTSSNNLFQDSKDTPTPTTPKSTKDYKN